MTDEVAVVPDPDPRDSDSLSPLELQLLTDVQQKLEAIADMQKSDPDLGSMYLYLAEGTLPEEKDAHTLNLWMEFCVMKIHTSLDVGVWPSPCL